MSQALALEDLLAAQHVWRGRPVAKPASGQPTGNPALDAALPSGGWPERSLIEILLGADGVGEIDLLMPTLARITQAKRTVVLIAPPYIPYAPAWQTRGVVLRHLDIVEADAKHSLWAFEQCLRSGSCAAVIGWPQQIDNHGLRRLQVAADTGHALGFAVRDRKHLDNPSPAALRLEISLNRQVSIRKCKGGVAPARSFPIALCH
ncbi:MAG TPA: translesion DNA synthesis-associated protein ImuA [Rudaea sp.]|jgi:cell division inhibitor SulA